MTEEAWRDLVDIERLRGWMDEQNLGAGTLEEIRPLTGGTQNILLGFTRAGKGYVLRRPPLHPRMDGNETMRREARVLGALAGTDVPHARLIAGCPETSVLGAAFYLMEPVAGFNATVALPPLHAGDPLIRRAMGFALIDGLTKLGRVDHLQAGLQTLGRADGFLERQVGRWRSQLEGYAEYAGWTGRDDLPSFERIASWLEANRPKTFLPGIMHGDYHLANVMYQNAGPDLAAIVDWELATIGDPLIDLGWVLATWPDGVAQDVDAVSVRPWDGFPSGEELITHYRGNTARDLSNIGWYRIFACYKLGILLEGTFARACAGKAPKATGDRLHKGAVNLFQRAERLLNAM